MPVDDPRELHPEPTDQELIRRLRSGDENALRFLIARYDRLVRYAVFETCKSQCVRDPQWLDAVASAAWMGFLQSMNRGSAINEGSVGRYLVRVARNQCLTAVRKESSPIRAFPFTPPLPGSDSASTGSWGDVKEESVSPESDPALILDQLEQLSILNQCLGQLSQEQRQVLTQLPVILSQKWTTAAESLGIAESTLRSRWKVILSDLRRCLEKKT